MSVTERSDKPDHFISESLVEAFEDAATHARVAAIIRQHLTNEEDIRTFALSGLDLSKTDQIMDLGCGFGYFTRGLVNRVEPNAKILGIDTHPEYRNMYLEACDYAGLMGDFSGKGISCIRQLPSNSYPLIICSFALYYFPDFIGEITRTIRKDGVFIAITHARNHLKEFKSMLKEIFAEQGITSYGKLPYEKVIRNFSDENGQKLMNEWFNKIKCNRFSNELVFRKGDEQAFEQYYRFKYPFFLPEQHKYKAMLFNLVLDRVKREISQKGEFRISKEDVIYICSGKK